eukprot:8187952-Pyramimonas_sp.AAC.1
MGDARVPVVLGARESGGPRAGRSPREVQKHVQAGVLELGSVGALQCHPGAEVGSASSAVSRPSSSRTRGVRESRRPKGTAESCA